MNKPLFRIALLGILCTEALWAAPVTSSVSGVKASFQRSFPPLSLTLLRLTVQD